MKIVAIDASTSDCSVGLKVDDDIKVLCHQSGRGGSGSLLPLLSRLLESSGLRPVDIDFWAYGRGPGSFTGIRIACAVAQGLALAQKKPVVPVSSLAAVAQQCQNTNILVANDARRQQVYWCCYQRDAGGYYIPVSTEQVDDPSHVRFSPDSFGAGNAWAVYGPQLHQSAVSGIESTGPLARGILLRVEREIAENGACHPRDSGVVYVRDQVVDR